MSDLGKERMVERYIKHGGMNSEQADRRAGEVARRVDRKESERKPEPTKSTPEKGQD